jgi:type IV secretory pathway VirB4 component
MESLHSEKLGKKTSTSPTQGFLDVAEVEEDTIVLKNGSLRSVLAVSAINYDLKSSEEQDAIIEQYQNFLNSIDFPIQILISSRKLNMDHYLEFIESKEKEQHNELLRLQISEYKNFINQLVSVSNIMDKNFYIVVPFAPIENTEKGFFSNLSNMINPQKNILEKRESFETYRTQLFQRVDHIIAGLSGIGLRIVPLKTQELIELLYESYNPKVFNEKELGEVGQLDIK